jgi:hypothetical protein
LIYADPLPIPVDLGQHYDKPPEEYWHEHYFNEADHYFGSQIDTFFHLWNGSGYVQPTALDVGAGLGKAMRSMAQRGLDAFGLEPSETFHARALEMGVEPGRLQLSSIEEADYPSDRFDFVTFGAVLEHLYDPASAIERALAWTRERGLMHIEVPSARWLTSRLGNLAYRLQGLDYSANISPMHVPYHLYEFTLTSFQEHARRAGYEVADHRRMTGRTFLPARLDKLGARVMAATGTGMQLEVWLRKPAA